MRQVRPPEWQEALGWVAVAAYAWHLVFRPALATAAPFVGVEIPPAPPLDLGEAAALVGGALGLGWIKNRDGPQPREPPTTTENR